jgi:hypothetical protein
MQNSRTAIDNGDPRLAWIARLGDLGHGPHEARRHTENERDPRQQYIDRLANAWQKRGDEDEDEEDDDPIPTKHQDAAASREIRFSDRVSFMSTTPIPHGLSTGEVLRLMRTQRHQRFGGAV